MDIDKKNRTELKAYFVKYAIPTERHFAELIDAMLNQADDGIAKSPGSPLCLEAAIDSAGRKEAIRFYDSFTEDEPAWVVGWNLRGRPGDSSTAGPGFLVSDGQGRSRLFIDRTTGKVGLGTTDPQAGLHVAGGDKAGPTQGDRLILGLPEEENLVLGDTGILARLDGEDSPLDLQAEGGELRVHGNLDESHQVVVRDDGHVGIGTTSPSQALTVAGTVFSTTGGFRFPDGTVQTTASRFGGSGELRLDSNLKLDGDLCFDDYARIRYLPGAGALEIGAPPESPDAVAVTVAGNLGIGTTEPRQTLHVNGDYYGKGHLWLHAKEGDGKSGTAYVQARDQSGKTDVALRFRTQEGGKVVDALTIGKGGHVGIGVKEPQVPLHVRGGSDAEPDGGGILVLGSASGKSLVFDDNEILARDRGSMSPLHLQANGGDLFIHYKAEAATRIVVKHDGKVGIGTNKPGQRLSVAGVVESTAGGFRFPDGSVQTTASPPPGGRHRNTSNEPARKLPVPGGPSW